MTNLSTLFFLSSIKPESEEPGPQPEDIIMMEEMESDQLVSAPENAVRNILGFARSYSSVPSILLEEIDLYSN